MPNISLYIDKNTMKKVKKAAEAENESISKWVGRQVEKTLETDYPANFEDLFGSVKDDSFTAPKSLPADYDAPREKL